MLPFPFMSLSICMPLLFTDKDTYQHKYRKSSKIKQVKYWSKITTNIQYRHMSILILMRIIKLAKDITRQ